MTRHYTRRELLKHGALYRNSRGSSRIIGLADGLCGPLDFFPMNVNVKPV